MWYRDAPAVYEGMNRDLLEGKKKELAMRKGRSAGPELNA